MAAAPGRAGWLPEGGRRGSHLAAAATPLALSSRTAPPALLRAEGAGTYLLPLRHLQITPAPPEASPGFYSPGAPALLQARGAEPGAPAPVGSPPGELSSRARSPTARRGLLCIAFATGRFFPAPKAGLHAKLLHSDTARPSSTNFVHFCQSCMCQLRKRAHR